MTIEDMEKEEVRLQLVFADMVISNRVSEGLVINELKDLKAEMKAMSIIANMRKFEAGKIF